MANSRRNALARTQGAGSELSNHEFGLFFAGHVSALFAAEDRGMPVEAPADVAEYMRRFNKRLKKAQTGSNHRRSLNGAAGQFHSLKGWRAEFPNQAEACVLAFKALSADQALPVGRPPGLVSRAVANLIEDGLAHGRTTDLRTLFESGGQNTPSPGRRRLAAEVLRLAEAEGIPIGLQEARGKIRMYIKDHVRLRKVPEAERKKIPAAGM